MDNWSLMYSCFIVIMNVGTTSVEIKFLERLRNKLNSQESEIYETNMQSLSFITVFIKCCYLSPVASRRDLFFPRKKTSRGSEERILRFTSITHSTGLQIIFCKIRHFFVVWYLICNTKDLRCSRNKVGVAKLDSHALMEYFLKFVGIS